MSRGRCDRSPSKRDERKLFRQPPNVDVGISEDARCAVEATSDSVTCSRRAAALSRRGLGNAESGGEG